MSQRPVETETTYELTTFGQLVLDQLKTDLDGINQERESALLFRDQDEVNAIDRHNLVLLAAIAAVSSGVDPITKTAADLIQITADWVQIMQTSPF